MLSQSQRSRAYRYERTNRGQGGFAFARTKQVVGIRPPDTREPLSRGEPAELILKRLGIALPRREGSRPRVLARLLQDAKDPNVQLLRKLGFKDSDAVRRAVVKVQLGS